MKTENEIKLEKELITMYEKLANVELQLSNESQFLKKYKKSYQEFEKILERWRLQLYLHNLYITWDEEQNLTLLKYKTTEVDTINQSQFDLEDTKIKDKILAFVSKPLND